jgi:predicted transcriptional regulator
MQKGALYRLLFELSNEDRMSILMRLQGSSSGLAELSRSLDLSPPEMFRELKRLHEASLICKDEDGRYHLAPFGKLVLSYVPALRFASTHERFFNGRDISGIPVEFVIRMGELSDAELNSEVASGFNDIARIINDAEEFIWLLSDKYFVPFEPLIASKVKKDFDLRGILPRALMSTVATDQAIPPGLPLRFLERVDVLLVVTDKASGFALPDTNRKFDYCGFKGCKDLFRYYWDRARPSKS